MPTPLRNTTPSRGCRDRGFSIIELLVAMAIAASLVVTITTVAQLFSRQVEEVRDTEGTQLERAMDQFVQQVSAAWIVEQPSDVRVDIQDAYGAVTSIYLGKKGTLYMSRPSGTLGVLLEDVADVEFSVSTTRRLREGAPVSQITPLQTIPNNGPEDTLVIDDGDAVAVAFTPPLPAPNGLNVVSGVTEEMIGASLRQLDLRIADMGYNLPQIEDDEGTGSDEVDKALLNGTQLDVCHVTEGVGYPDEGKTLIVGGPALSFHVSHGDHAGDCYPFVPSPGTVEVELFEGRAPGDGRPYGASLGMVSVPAALLPRADYAAAGDGKGNIVKNVKPPESFMGIDLVPLSHLVEPGHAYTLAVRMNGLGRLALAIDPADGGDVAYKTAATADYATQSWGVARRVAADASYTQASEADVVETVSLRIEMTDGRVLTGSATLGSQDSAENEWFGAVPGEIPTLESAGS